MSSFAHVQVFSPSGAMPALAPHSTSLGQSAQSEPATHVPRSTSQSPSFVNLQVVTCASASPPRRPSEMRSTSAVRRIMAAAPALPAAAVAVAAVIVAVACSSTQPRPALAPAVSQPKRTNCAVSVGGGTA